MKTCTHCKKQYEAWLTIHNDVYNIDLIQSLTHLCIDCHERKRKIKVLEDDISTKQFMIEECKRDIKLIKSHLQDKLAELRDLEWEDWHC